MIVLRAEDVWKRYDDTIVLRGVSLNLKKGETKVIMGPSGAGKTTFLKCLNLLVKPDKGRIWIDGEEITSPKADITRLRQKIGFVFQELNLFHHLTAIGNVMIGLTKVKGMSKSDALKKAKETLKRVHIEEELWRKYPAQLSGGQKQRVAIARALAMDPIVMLYDEPTSALDPGLSSEVLLVIKELSERGITSLIVTHELGFAYEVADEIVVMNRGRIIGGGSPEELRNAKNDEVRNLLNKWNGLKDGVLV
ncbi:MAG: amino acid ABC transporter ATP-binding protein [Candidatus Korarchaeota archaeon]|nr:amino acid ABC transporter ATP-binding protein [Candidatus Korarchaeota archaeon]